MVGSANERQLYNVTSSHWLSPYPEWSFSRMHCYCIITGNYPDYYGAGPNFSPPHDSEAEESPAEGGGRKRCYSDSVTDYMSSGSDVTVDDEQHNWLRELAIIATGPRSPLLQGMPAVKWVCIQHCFYWVNPLAIEKSVVYWDDLFVDWASSQHIKHRSLVLVWQKMRRNDRKP